MNNQRSKILAITNTLDFDAIQMAQLKRDVLGAPLGQHLLGQLCKVPEISKVLVISQDPQLKEDLKVSSAQIKFVYVNAKTTKVKKLDLIRAESERYLKEFEIDYVLLFELNRIGYKNFLNKHSLGQFKKTKLRDVLIGNIRLDYLNKIIPSHAIQFSNIRTFVSQKIKKHNIQIKLPECFLLDGLKPENLEFVKAYLDESNSITNSSSRLPKLLLSDVDGVLTDAGMYYTENGDEFKKFSTYDGMGFKLLQSKGVKVGILTAENRHLNRNRANKLKLDYQFHGIENKLETFEKLLGELNLNWEEAAYVGDDINDIEVLKKVGFAFCPSSAMQEIRSLPHIKVLNSSGGTGIIREIYRQFYD